MHANPRKTKAVRFLGPVDLGGVRDEILAIPEEIWARENASKPNKFGALDQTQHIIFRFVSSFEDWRQSYETPLWSDWKSRIEPLLAQATRPYGYANGAFPRVMLAKMPPNGIIHPHVDANPAARWPHKIHIPILTNPGVAFYVEPETYHFEVGQAYEVNNLGRHAVHNGGSEPRIHLIFEYYDVDQA